MCKRKKLFMVLMTLIIATGIIFAAGCSSDSTESNGDKEISVDTKALAADIVAKVKFVATMNEIDSELLDINYTVEEGTTGVSYKAGGQVADEVTIFTAKDEESAKKMLDNVKEYIDEQKDIFVSYAPAEVAKLEKAIAIQKGKYVVFCVTADVENAKTIINKAF